LSNNDCAFSDVDTDIGCEEKLTDPTWTQVKAQICHIRGLGPRKREVDASMTDDQRRC